MIQVLKSPLSIVHPSGEGPPPLYCQLLALCSALPFMQSLDPEPQLQQSHRDATSCR